MPTTARREEGRGSGPVVHLAFELGATEWKLGRPGGARTPSPDAVETATVASLPEEVRGMDVGDGGERAGRGEDPDARLTPARHTNE
jgi:hypothetical protein